MSTNLEYGTQRNLLQVWLLIWKLKLDPYYWDVVWCTCWIYIKHKRILQNSSGNGNNLKNNFLREFSRYLHKTERHNFYSLQSGNWTFLDSALSRKLIFFFFVTKSDVFLYQNFSTIKGQNIFLNMLNMLENSGQIMFDVNIQKLKENITSIKNQLAVHQLNHF